MEPRTIFASAILYSGHVILGYAPQAALGYQEAQTAASATEEFHSEEQRAAAENARQASEEAAQDGLADYERKRNVPPSNGPWTYIATHDGSAVFIDQGSLHYSRDDLENLQAEIWILVSTTDGATRLLIDVDCGLDVQRIRQIVKENDRRTFQLRNTEPTSWERAPNGSLPEIVASALCQPR